MHPSAVQVSRWSLCVTPSCTCVIIHHVAFDVGANEMWVVIHRKTRRYERWPRRPPPTRSSASPAVTTIPGRSRTNRGSIILTSSKLSSQTLTASYRVRALSHTHTHTHWGTHRKVCWRQLSNHLSICVLSRLSCKRVLHQIKTTYFRVVTHLVSHRSSCFCLHQISCVLNSFVFLLAYLTEFAHHDLLSNLTDKQETEAGWSRIGSTNERLPAVVKIHSHSALCCVLPGSCQTLTRTERWLWMSSVPPSIWLWPGRTATTSPRSCLRAWCQS